MQYKKYKFGIQPYKPAAFGTRTASTADYHERIVEARNPIDARNQVEAQYPRDWVVISNFGEVR